MLGQSHHDIYLGTRGLRLVTKLRCSSVFEQKLVSSRGRAWKPYLTQYLWLLLRVEDRICKAINIKTQNNEEGKTMPYVTIKKTIH